MAQPISVASPPRQARLERMATIVAVLVSLMFVARLVMTVAERANEPVSDFAAFYDGASRLRAGLPLYQTGVDFYEKAIQYIYPPPIALLLTPLANYATAWWVWAAVCFACWVASLWLLLAELAGPLRERISPLWRPVLLAALINFTPVISHFFWGQTQLQLLLALVGSWMLLRRGRDIPAGALLGLTIAVKIFPALILAPLFIRRRWAFLVSAGATTAAILAVSYAIVGWNQAFVFFGDILPRHSGSVIAHSTAHTTFASMFTNLTGNAGLAFWLSLAARGLVMLAVVYAAWRTRDAAQAFALGMTTLVLVTPVVWEHYFVLMYLPWLDAMARSTRRQLAPLMLAYFLLAAALFVYYAPDGLLWFAQLMPIAGALIVLGVQVAQSGRADAGVADRGISAPGKA